MPLEGRVLYEYSRIKRSHCKKVYTEQEKVVAVRPPGKDWTLRALIVRIVIDGNVNKEVKRDNMATYLVHQPVSTGHEILNGRKEAGEGCRKQTCTGFFLVCPAAHESYLFTEELQAILVTL